MEHTQNIVYAPKSLKVEFQVSAHTTMIDVDTTKHIELLAPSMKSRSGGGHSLFGLLNHCCTPGGVRHLRANLFQPPVQTEIIEGRLNASKELMEKPGIYHSVLSVVSRYDEHSGSLSFLCRLVPTIFDVFLLCLRFCDIDQLLGLCVAIPKQENMHTLEQRLNNVIGLKHALEMVLPLHNALEGVESTVLVEARNMLEVLDSNGF